MVINILNDFRSQNLIPFGNILLLHQPVAFNHNRKQLTGNSDFVQLGLSFLRLRKMPLYLLMVTTMRNQAFAMIPDQTGLMLHSDQGWHYRHRQYRKMLLEKGIVQSMSHEGNCLDNSVMENFFGHLKSELLYLQEFESMEHFKAELIEYIDYYNNRRIKARRRLLYTDSKPSWLLEQFVLVMFV